MDKMFNHFSFIDRYFEASDVFAFLEKGTLFFFLFLAVLWLPLFLCSNVQGGLNRSYFYITVSCLLLSCIVLLYTTSILLVALALESVAFCSYILVGSKQTLRAAAAGYLYNLLGSIVTVVLIFALAILIYGSGGASYD